MFRFANKGTAGVNSLLAAYPPLRNDKTRESLAVPLEIVKSEVQKQRACSILRTSELQELIVLAYR